MSREMKVQCPRCGRILSAFNGTPDIQCGCHLWCDDGEKPSDCSVTYPYNWSGEWKWGSILHVGSTKGWDRKHQARGYCSVHDRYYYKDIITIDLNWKQWFSKRAPKKFRMSQGLY